MKEKKETRSLQVVLTEKELLDLSKQLAKHAQDLKDKENRKTETMKVLNAEISGHKANVEALSLKISNGYEYRDVECVWVIDTENDKKTLFRNDTSEIVKTEPLSTEDRQKSFI